MRELQELEHRFAEDARQYEIQSRTQQLEQLKNAHKQIQAIGAVVRNHLTAFDKQINSDLTTLNDGERQAFHQLVGGLNELERQVERAIEEERESLERSIKYLNGELTDEKKWDEKMNEMTDGQWDECKDCDMAKMSLASKSAKTQESSFASSFGYGAAAGAAMGAVGIYLFNNKSKTATDAFERI